MTDVANKLWGFCSVLRHDGIDYGDYIEQLAYLLFIKMADERGLQLPTYGELNEVSGQIEQVPCDWPYLRKQSGTQLTEHYTKVLDTLGKERGILGDIFGGSQNRFGNPVNLHRLVRPYRRDRVDCAGRGRQGGCFRRPAGESSRRGQEGCRPVLHSTPPHPVHDSLHQP